jgi:hypothetical protein
VDAFQVQSRAALTETATCPPSCGTDVGWPCTVVWQRTASGPTTLDTDVDPPHDQALAATAAAQTDAAIRREYG